MRGNCKLDWRTVREIRHRMAQPSERSGKQRIRNLAFDLGVSTRTIERVLGNHTWKEKVDADVTR